MFQKTETERAVSFKFSSDFFLVDLVLSELDAFFKKAYVETTFEFKVIVRELLINAVEHGNQNRKSKVVFCKIEQLDDGRFCITVEDQGKGFDYKSLNMDMPTDPLQDRNRGYALINAFSERLEFYEAGKRISAFVACKP